MVDIAVAFSVSFFALASFRWPLWFSWRIARLFLTCLGADSMYAKRWVKEGVHLAASKNRQKKKAFVEILANE
jgi:hypothetical protein